MAACGDRLLPPPDTSSEKAAEEAKEKRAKAIEAALFELNQWEARERSATRFAALAPFETISGSNPQAVAAVGPNRAVGLLRGSSQVVLLDGSGKELARVPAPKSPVALAVTERDRGRTVLVVGEGSGEIWRYAIEPAGIAQLGTRIVNGASSLRAIASASSRTVVADAFTGAIIELDRRKLKAQRVISHCHNPTALSVTDSYTIANCMSDHQLRIWRGKKELAPIEHNGPIWAFSASENASGELVIGASGIEDKALDRSDRGSFGHVDSYVYLYRLAPRASAAKRLTAINVAEHGLITPKWIELETAGAGATLRTAGYGSSNELTILWPASDFARAPQVAELELAPGTSASARLGEHTLYANDLFDGWMNEHGKLIAVGSDSRSIESRIGELLFFTGLMAPWSSAEGRKSKFTCEACHFEGYVDGRIHFTGRDDVSATSRPLRGLFNNAPHFTRALDETTTEMVNNEFRVANKLNGRSPWFELKAADFPWLERGGLAAPALMSPAYLRRSLMVFLRDFTHGPNPAVRGRGNFSALEKKGAALFRDHCEECHRSQLNATDERSRIAFDAWEANIFSPTSAIVWGRTGYEKTGVLPYVHERGARPPTLRRLYKKWPFFTNGSAKSLADVLDSVRVGLPEKRFSHGFSHASEPGGRELRTAERGALHAFLELL